MDRRTFMVTGFAGSMTCYGQPMQAFPKSKGQLMRNRFFLPQDAIYLNAAAQMPLADFSAGGLERFLQLQRQGLLRNDYLWEMWRGIRSLFAQLIGASKDEIGLVHCTKAGEQIALDGVDGMKKGGNIVTNDLHFTGSLHNLVGLKKAGRDVRIVKARQWQVPLEDMLAAIDDSTALVALSLVSNINGHVADIQAITEKAHRHGALVYADIIQAAGIVPLDMHAMNIDIAACSAYKWLYGIHGAGFLYVRKAIQGKGLPDRLYPGQVDFNYAPWTDKPVLGEEELSIHPRETAARYEPGHVNYMGYSAAFEALKWLQENPPEKLLPHSVALNKRLLQKVDPKRFRCISPDLDRSPILTLLAEKPTGLPEKLKAAAIIVTPTANRIRIAPAIFNNETDMDALAEVLNRA